MPPTTHDPQNVPRYRRPGSQVQETSVSGTLAASLQPPFAAPTIRHLSPHHALGDHCQRHKALLLLLHRLLLFATNPAKPRPMLTFDDVFDDELVEVVSRDDREGVFRVRIGELTTVVTIRLKKRSTIRGKVDYTTSHVIHTPIQGHPYRTSLPFGDNRPAAVAKALHDLTLYYRLATHDGHQPNTRWLVAY